MYLAQFVSSTIDSILATANASTDKVIFSALNHGTATYTRNSSCWISDFDLTGLSPWNSDGVSQKPGTAISPRHVVFSTHYCPAVSSTIRFVTSDGTVITRTVSDLESLPIESGIYPDITIALLDSDLPSSIGFHKVLPDGWESYLPLQDVPLIVLDQDEKALCTDMSSLSIISPLQLICSEPTDTDRLAFYEALVSGDSGHPFLMPINGELVLIAVAAGAGAGSGTSVSGFLAELNALMTTLGGGYQLAEIDLTAFTPVPTPTPTPTLSFVSKADGEIVVSWDGVFNADLYIDNVKVAVNQPSPTALTGLTNFVEVDIKIKPVYGHLQGSFSNVISDYPSYGPVSIPVGDTTVAVPDGAWTVSTILWGVSGAVPVGFIIVNNDGSDLWAWTGSAWISETTEEDGGAVVLTGNITLVLQSGGTPFSIWNGMEP